MNVLIALSLFAECVFTHLPHLQQQKKYLGRSPGLTNSVQRKYFMLITPKLFFNCIHNNPQQFAAENNGIYVLSLSVSMGQESEHSLAGWFGSGSFMSRHDIGQGHCYQKFWLGMEHPLLRCLVFWLANWCWLWMLHSVHCHMGFAQVGTLECPPNAVSD